MEKKSLFGRWRANFITGLFIVMPSVVSIAIVVWLFGTVANITDTLLFFLKYLLDRKWIYVNGTSGPMFWYWSLLALIIAVLLVSLVGRLARNYMGRRMIVWADGMMMRVPVLNKIYGAFKQINDAFSSGSKNSFKTVVLVEFPRAGAHSIGFITSEQNDEVQARTREKVVCVFVPTTPNPTSGFLILVPETEVTKLDMSVADGIKYIVSLGAISPPYPPPPQVTPPAHD
ncbi:MAG TPA: DUF502 domain-containing protein [Dongiaceae bacterium]|jgi:uncharacterized membrane protein|nr:DUF502 domain-containing protein [Dongiaceae bacterium]